MGKASVRFPPIVEIAFLGIRHSMKTPASFSSWWCPLPRWLKVVTALGVYPPWLFIIYCVLTGQAKSVGALVAFSVFAFCTVLHIIFDSRNRRDGRGANGGFDLSDGGE